MNQCVHTAQEHSLIHYSRHSMGRMTDPVVYGHDRMSSKRNLESTYIFAGRLAAWQNYP